MRHTLIELAHLAAGLIVVALLTWGAAWAYPLGAPEVRVIGGVAFVLVVLINVRAVREALAKDRANG
ncbi:MAG: hypothetical protein V4659_05740 [Pseudomonadota bacterium]